jgi:hypothetical protein
MSKAEVSFAEKAKKAAEREKGAKSVLVIQSTKDARTGSVKFSDRVVTIPADSDMDSYLKEIVEPKKEAKSTA